MALVNSKLTHFICAVSLFGALPALPSQAAEPTAAFDRPAACRILDFLGELSQDDRPRFISGQNLGHANFEPADSFESNVVDLRRVSKRWPGIVAADFGFDEIPADLDDATGLLALHWKHGGLVAASMHPPNPWRQSEAHDRKTGPFADLFREGSAARSQWRRDLSRIAEGLASLRDQGVIVLWRPLHEMNGNWFWWGKQVGNQGLDRDEFAQLWQDMFEYFTVERKLDNLLWVYSPNVQTGREIASVTKYYPGDQYVDIVAMDWYDDRFMNLNAFGSYSQLASLGKPMGLAEVGPQNQRDGSFDNLVLLQRLKKDYPKLGFFVFWHSWTGANVAMIDNIRPVDMMQHELVLDRDELPNFLRPATPKSRSPRPAPR
jgi:mannan endo-1,4-beta-mannosidase